MVLKIPYPTHIILYIGLILTVHTLWHYVKKNLNSTSIISSSLFCDTKQKYILPSISSF